MIGNGHAGGERALVIVARLPVDPGAASAANLDFLRLPWVLRDIEGARGIVVAGQAQTVNSGVIPHSSVRRVRSFRRASGSLIRPPSRRRRTSARATSCTWYAGCRGSGSARRDWRVLKLSRDDDHGVDHPAGLRALLVVLVGWRWCRQRTSRPDCRGEWRRGRLGVLDGGRRLAYHPKPRPAIAADRHRLDHLEMVRKADDPAPRRWPRLPARTKAVAALLRASCAGERAESVDQLLARLGQTPPLRSLMPWAVMSTVCVTDNEARPPPPGESTVGRRRTFSLWTSSPWMVTPGLRDR